MTLTGFNPLASAMQTQSSTGAADQAVPQIFGDHAGSDLAGSTAWGIHVVLAPRAG